LSTERPISTGEAALDSVRYQRVRQVVRGLNRARRVQAKKIDILCNDMVSAHRDFIERLKPLTFSVQFYEAILGCGDLNVLVERVGAMIGTAAPEASVAIFLLSGEGYELHISGENRPIEVDAGSFEGCFTAHLVARLSGCGRICMLEDMLGMGLRSDLAGLEGLSAASVPLSNFGRVFGFILLYRTADKGLTGGELAKVSAIVPGLSSAINGIQTAARPTHIPH
jgi:hypothetical protein